MRERVVGKMMDKKKVYYHDKNHSRKVGRIHAYTNHQNCATKLEFHL